MEGGGLVTDAARSRAREHLFVERLGNLLRERDWHVETEASLGGVHPDLVLRDPRGRVYLAEVSLSGGTAHFSSIAQVAAYAKRWESVSEQPATAVLITDSDVTPPLEVAARSVGVEVIPITSADLSEPATVAEQLATQMADA